MQETRSFSRRHGKLDWRALSDEEIDAYVRRTGGTCLHFSSTCRMSNDPTDGVVDQRLRVQGLTNLRIADASVFPKILEHAYDGTGHDDCSEVRRVLDKGS